MRTGSLRMGNIVMRFSEKGAKLYDALEAHAASCEICEPRARGEGGRTAEVLYRYGCVGGVILAQAWEAEYKALHSPKERAAHDEHARKYGIDAIAKAIRSAKAGKGGDA